LKKKDMKNPSSHCYYKISFIEAVKFRLSSPNSSSRYFLLPSSTQMPCATATFSSFTFQLSSNNIFVTQEQVGEQINAKYPSPHRVTHENISDEYWQISYDAVL